MQNETSRTQKQDPKPQYTNSGGRGVWTTPPLSRTFESGATRDTDEGKFDFEGFLSPLVLERYAEYMHKHRVQSDGALRDSDNWQKGIPKDAYMKSMWRHFFDVWKYHRQLYIKCVVEEALCALLFNVMGYLHEVLNSATIIKEGGRRSYSSSPWSDKE